MVQTICRVGCDYGMEYAETALATSEEARAIHKALQELGLRAMPERAHLANVYSPRSATAIAIGTIPYVTDDFSMHAGLSVSDRGHAKAVAVRMADRTELVGFTTFDVEDGEVRTEQLDVGTLKEMGARELADELGVVPSPRPLVDLSIGQVRSLTGMVFHGFLDDESSRRVYSEQEIRALRGNAGIVDDIALLILFRSSSSPGGCSCSSSCWGCSSCSCSWS
jgi:hypothetical protein